MPSYLSQFFHHIICNNAQHLGILIFWQDNLWIKDYHEGRPALEVCWGAEVNGMAGFFAFVGHFYCSQAVVCRGKRHETAGWLLLPYNICKLGKPADCHLLDTSKSESWLIMKRLYLDIPLGGQRATQRDGGVQEQLA